MTLEDQILALCAEAEPLRCLPDEEAEARGLPKLVERINLLRGMQMTQRADNAINAQFLLMDAEANGRLSELDAARESLFKGAVNAPAMRAEVLINSPKRRGRPPKAKVEGADA
jgi:hypothetical protein